MIELNSQNQLNSYKTNNNDFIYKNVNDTINQYYTKILRNKIYITLHIRSHYESYLYRL